MSNLLAFDFGMNNIGIATGNTDTKVAFPYKSLKAKNGIPNWDILGAILKEWDPSIIIVGLPLDLHGNFLPEITQKAKKFANRIHGRYGIKVVMHDERLTTVEAKSNIYQHHGFKKLDKDNIDNISAVIILESWFEQNI